MVKGVFIDWKVNYNSITIATSKGGLNKQRWLKPHSLISLQYVWLFSGGAEVPILLQQMTQYAARDILCLNRKIVTNLT